MKKRFTILFFMFTCFWLILGFLSCQTDDYSSSTSNENAADDDDDDDDNNDDNDDSNEETRQISQDELEDKIRGSWVGQMAGVTWGAKTEFKYMGEIIPEDKVPTWDPERINRGYIQDDIYVEITFLDAMVLHGVNPGWQVFGDFFSNSHYPLAHANLAARSKLRKGIPAPDSGHYSNNKHCDDIDWQIEADYIGSMCPGLENAAVELAWKAGHVMNFGDGVLGGVFISAMHAAAFFAADVMEIIEAGRRAVPENTKYRQVLEDVIDWHAQGFTWVETWHLLQDRWGMDDRCPTSPYWLSEFHNIDAKLNGAYVLIGLLYGGGDFEQSMKIAMRCGQDSDCNPSSVGGILGNWVGLSGIPDQFKSELDSELTFIFTDYSLENAIEAQLNLADKIMTMSGAVVEKIGTDEIWTIPPKEKTLPPIFEQWPELPNDQPLLSAEIAGQNGLTVEFSAEATDSDGILAYEWYFGDLVRSTESEPVHKYEQPGTYDVIVFAADAIGNTSRQSLWVTVP